MLETNPDVYMTLLEISSTLIGLGLPSALTLQSNRWTKGIRPKYNRQQVLSNNNESIYTALLERQPKASQNIDTFKNIPFLPTASIVVV